MSFSAWSDVPTTQTFSFFRASRARARFDTWKNGTLSAAPQAVFRTTPVRPADLSRGATRQSHPAASAARNAAPRFLGSVTSSRMMMNGGWSRERMKFTRSVSFFAGCSRALITMPWWISPSVIASSVFRGAFCGFMPTSRRSESTSDMRESSRPSRTQASSTLSGDFLRAASTGCIPKISVVCIYS